MDKGIRPYANALFLQSLPARVNTTAGNTAFRKTIIASCMEEFNITLASAATHYNHAFINAKELAKMDATVATALEGLGRAEDKKGGRKVKAKVEAAAPVAEEPAAVGEVLQSLTLNSDEMTGTEEEPVAEVAVLEEPVLKYSVRKVSDKTVVCEDLSLEQAETLIAKAASAKKAKLELVP